MSINSLQEILKLFYISHKVKDFAMKIKNRSVITNHIYLNEFKNKNKYQIPEEYWKKRKKECENNLSKFC